jgi:hypothetical protein
MYKIGKRGSDPGINIREHTNDLPVFFYVVLETPIFALWDSHDSEF